MASQLLLVSLLIFAFFSQIEGSTTQNAIQSACDLAQDPKFYESSLTQVAESLRAGPTDLSKIALKMSIAEAKIVDDFIPRRTRSRKSSLDSKQNQAIEDCKQLYDLTLDYLTESLSKLTSTGVDSVKWSQAIDIQSFLSAALTNQATCLDGLNEANANLRSFSFTNHINNASRSVSNSLALIKKFWIASKGSQKPSVHNRRMLSSDEHL